MNEQYIKQLEDANEKLKNSLERESMLKEIESNRHKRWYRVELYHINHTNTKGAIESGEVWEVPPLWAGDACHTYDVPGIEAARSIILSHIFMRELDDGGSIGGGISWIVKLASKRNQNGSWDPSRYLRKGWIVICPHYPAWGGSYIKHINPKQDTVGVTESHFHNYSDYAKWVQEKENQK